MISSLGKLSSVEPFISFDEGDKLRLALAVMSMTANHQTDGLCLRFPENLPPHSSLTHEVAVQMLVRAVSLATQIAFQPSYVDKPPGPLLLPPTSLCIT